MAASVSRPNQLRIKNSQRRTAYSYMVAIAAVGIEIGVGLHMSPIHICAVSRNRQTDVDHREDGSAKQATCAFVAPNPKWPTKD
jgi:hypothetical protein